MKNRSCARFSCNVCVEQDVGHKYDNWMGKASTKGRKYIEVMDVNELELKEQAIREFVNLQRVKTAENKEN